MGTVRDARRVLRTAALARFLATGRARGAAPALGLCLARENHELVPTEPNAIVRSKLDRLRDSHVVHPNAVATREIDELAARIADDDLRVMAGDERIVERDWTLCCAA